MDITVSTENGRVPVTIMHLSGNLDSANFMAFQDKADELIKAGAQYILVDLSNVPYVSTAGFRVIHHIFNELRSRHPDANLSDEEVRKGISAGTYSSPHIKLLNLSKETQKAFEMTGFDMYIETYTDPKKAVSAF
jgi:anti-anti-sigma factor